MLQVLFTFACLRDVGSADSLHSFNLSDHAYIHSASIYCNPLSVKHCSEGNSYSGK